MILNDEAIAALGRQGVFDPYELEHVQPASIDLRLSDHYRVFQLTSVAAVDLADPASYAEITREVRTPRFVLHPGEFVLASTLERVNMPNDLVARVEGKSSLGRLGLIVHATAGYIDPGFSGTITLEMTNLLRVPITLSPGLCICQLSFLTMNAPPLVPYQGRYQNSNGTVQSRL